MIQRWQRSPTTQNFVPTKSQRRRWKLIHRFAAGGRVLNLLRRIEADGRRLSEEPYHSNRRFWLFPFRDELRRYFDGVDYRFHEGQLLVLQYYLSTCPREMIPICIWLIARCTDRFRLYELKTFCRDPNPRIRKHLAKALRQLEAWSLLAEMATAYPGNQTIQWFAKTPTTRRPYRERLSRFVEALDTSHAAEAVGPSRMAYWSRFTPWQGSPPKSLSYIRSILLHIRSLLRGNGMTG